MRTERNEGDKSVPAFCDSFGVDDRGEREREELVHRGKSFFLLWRPSDISSAICASILIFLSPFFILALSLFLSLHAPQTEQLEKMNLALLFFAALAHSISTSDSAKPRRKQCPLPPPLLYILVWFLLHFLNKISSIHFAIIYSGRCRCHSRCSSRLMPAGAYFLIKWIGLKRKMSLASGLHQCSNRAAPSRSHNVSRETKTTARAYKRYIAFMSLRSFLTQ